MGAAAGAAGCRAAGEAGDLTSLTRQRAQPVPQLHQPLADAVERRVVAPRYGGASSSHQQLVPQPREVDPLAGMEPTMVSCPPTAPHRVGKLVTFAEGGVHQPQLHPDGLVV